MDYEWDPEKDKANFLKHEGSHNTHHIGAKGHSKGMQEVFKRVMRSEYNFDRGKRGAVDPLPKGKVRITIRIDEDVLDWFREEVEQAGGGNYQTLMNAALREFVRKKSEALEETLRRVLKEELGQSKTGKRKAG